MCLILIRWQKIIKIHFRRKILIKKIERNLNISFFRLINAQKAISFSKKYGNFLNQFTYRITGSDQLNRRLIMENFLVITN